MVQKLPRSLRKPTLGQPFTVRIFEVDIPLPTDDVNTLKNACQVPIYQPGIVSVGGKGGAVTTAGGQPGQVVAGFAVGFNGGQALIIRETAAALDDLRAEIDILKKGLRAALNVGEELARHAKIGQDGRTARNLEAIADDVKSLRDAFFPDEPETKSDGQD